MHSLLIASTLPLPLTPDMLSSLLSVALVALLTSLCHRASRWPQGRRPALQVVGATGLETLSGLCVSLLLAFVCERLSGNVPDLQARLGFGILGAYMGRDALKAIWNVLMLWAQAKGLVTNLSKSPKNDG